MLIMELTGLVNGLFVLISRTTMTTEEARQLIGLVGGFSPEELEATVRRRSQELESKIECAPTRGLKEKYRGILNQLEEAWEVLSCGCGSKAADNFPSLHPVIEEKIPPPPEPVESKAGEIQQAGRARRPILVWIISIYYLTGAGSVMFFSVLSHFITTGSRFHSQSETTLDYVMHTATLIEIVFTAGIGAVFLFLLRRSSFYFFAFNFGFDILVGMYNMVSKTPSGSLIMVMLIGWGFNFVVLFYIKYLIRMGVLT